MLLGVSRLKRAVLLVFILAPISLVLSCGSSSSNAKTGTSGLKFRALVSQSVNSSVVSAGLIIVNADKDVRAPVTVISTGTGSTPGMMVVSNNRKLTLAFSPAANTIAVVNNQQEAMSTTTPISIPGPTESMAISADNLTGFAAVPTAPIPGGSPGGIVVMNLTAGTITSTVQVPGVHYIVQSPDGSRLLGFSDNSDSVSILSPFSVVPGQSSPCVPAVLPPPANPPVCTTVSGFNRPVFGFFSSDGTTAWILNCGPECGGAPGVTASLQVLDLVNDVTGPILPIPGGATVGFLNNQTLYVAGTPVQPGVNTCTGGLPTAATNCGRVTVIDLPSLTITGTAIITDGYHNRINLGDGQLFVGSRTCTNIVPAKAGDEQRGCLSIVNTNAGNAVVVPPDNGDVTGIQPITGRTIVYVCEGGNFRIYDTTTDKIYTVTSLDLLGDPVDVKLIDF
jgi:hypothetical protein